MSGCSLEGSFSESLSEAPREDIVRVLKIIEFVGPRSAVEKQMAQGLGSGTKMLPSGVTINSAILNGYPEILSSLPPHSSGTTEDFVVRVLKANNRALGLTIAPSDDFVRDVVNDLVRRGEW